MSFYLSVDIDYWTDTYWDSYGSSQLELVDCLNQLAFDAKKYNIPIISMRNHQQMLPYVQKSSARELINIDAHSDLVEERPIELTCGSWVKFVNWRKQGTYHWVRPNGLIINGDCNRSTPIFHENGRANQKLSHWNLVKHSTSHNTLKSILNNIQHCDGIGVCSSPEWSSIFEMNVFEKWRKDHSIHYTRGKPDQDK